MLLEHYGLIEDPFGVTPDPRFLHLGPQHREALASLIHETDNNRGFVALIGQPGTGKTSLLLNYLESLRYRARTAYLFQNPGTPRELLRYLLADLGLHATGKDLPGMHEMLNAVLADEMRAGRRVVLVVDEAQNLDEKVLEFIRLLSNFETPWAKLLHIVLAGQPQLAERLALPSLAQLRQRISSIISLGPFTEEETLAYIAHRLWVAGYIGSSLFSGSAARLIAANSGGIPRNINNLCFHSMLLAYASNDRTVHDRIVNEAIADLSFDRIFYQPKRPEMQALSRMWTVFRTVSAVKLREFIPTHIFGSRSRRAFALFVAACTAMFLGVVSGASRKTALPLQALDAAPSIETAVFPAPVLASVATAAVKIHPDSPSRTSRRQKVRRSARSRSLPVKDNHTLSAKSSAAPKTQEESPEQP